MADPHAPARTWPAIDLDLRPGASLPPDADDRLALAFDDAGVTAIEHEAGVHWRVYFADPGARDAARGVLRNALGAWLDLHDADVPDEGWATKVQRDLGAVRAGRFLVAPPWDVPPAAPGVTTIVVEPSVGFGTGHHQSTRLCLRALDRLDLRGRTVIDVGTGSGVLAIAAALRGARQVIALDNDTDALGAARANISRNHVTHIAFAEIGDVEGRRLAPGDFVLANLTMHLLRGAAVPLAALVAQGGTLVMSGFTHDQVELVLEAFPGFAVEAREDEDDWVSVTLTKR